MTFLVDVFILDRFWKYDQIDKTAQTIKNKPKYILEYSTLYLNANAIRSEIIEVSKIIPCLFSCGGFFFSRSEGVNLFLPVIYGKWWHMYHTFDRNKCSVVFWVFKTFNLDMKKLFDPVVFDFKCLKTVSLIVPLICS